MSDVPNNASGFNIEQIAGLAQLCNAPVPYSLGWEDKESMQDAMAQAYSLPTVARYCKAVRNVVYLSRLYVLHDEGFLINNSIEDYAIKMRTIDKDHDSNQDQLDTSIRRFVWGGLKNSHRYYPAALNGFPLPPCDYDTYYNDRRKLSAERIASLNDAQTKLDDFIKTQHPEPYTIQYLVRKISGEYGIHMQTLTFGDYMIRHVVGTKENPNQVVN